MALSSYWGGFTRSPRRKRLQQTWQWVHQPTLARAAPIWHGGDGRVKRNHSVPYTPGGAFHLRFPCMPQDFCLRRMLTHGRRLINLDFIGTTLYAPSYFLHLSGRCFLWWILSIIWANSQMDSEAPSLFTIKTPLMPT